MPQVLHIRDVINLEEGWGSAVKIDRSTRWGNPFIISGEHDREEVCRQYKEWLLLWVQEGDELKMGQGKFSNKWVMEHIDQLKGKDLVCWCSPLRCHGETLLALANNGMFDVIE